MSDDTLHEDPSEFESGCLSYRDHHVVEVLSPSSFGQFAKWGFGLISPREQGVKPVVVEQLRMGMCPEMAFDHRDVSVLIMRVGKGALGRLPI